MENTNNKNNSKTKGIVAVIIAIVAVVAGVSLYLIASTPKLELKQETFKVEYGETVSNKVATYISDDFKAVEDVKLNLEIKNEKDKEYPAVGEYKGTVSYKNTVLEFKVIVEDTTAPVFKNFKDVIKIEKNAENVEYDEYFKAEDLSGAAIEIDVTKVKLNKEGKYEVEVIAMDKYDNKTTKAVTIEVINKKEADKGEATKYADGSAAPKAKEEKKEDSKTTQSSSSSSSSSSSNGGSSSSSGNSGSSGGNSSSGNSGNSSGTTVTFPEGYNQNEAMAVYNVINQLRRQEGLGDLPYDSSLQWMADNRAKAIITNFSHEGSYSKMGLKEVIAQMGTGQGSAAYGWKNSTGHWNAITRQDNIGIAISCYQHNGYYYYVGVISYDTTPEEV